MIEHVTDLLGAYVDGELHGLRLRQVENHLSQCASCRKELVDLQGLSNLLQKSVPMDAFTPADKFAANMVLRLSAGEARMKTPRRAATTVSRKPLSFIWWLAPVGLLGAWIFLQAVYTVGTVISTADFTGLLGNAAAMVQNTPQQTLWFSTTMSLFGNQIQGNGRTVLDLLNGFSVFGSSFAIQLLLQAGIALVYWVWLGLWWRRRQAAVSLPMPTLPQHS